MTMNSNLPDNPNLQIDYQEKALHDIWLAGGCFWGVEAYLERLPGVAKTDVGYANGRGETPTYQQVCTGKTGFAETVHIRYAPDILRLEDLLLAFFSIIDPTSINRQGNDVGSQYRSGIYYHDPADLAVIEKVMSSVSASQGREVVTEVKPLRNYYLAEDYHQKYLDHNPNGYCHVDLSKPPRIPARYERPSDEDLRRILSPMEYNVTQKDATEQPFTGAYWDLDQPGIYVDVTTGEPLFCSSEKFDAGCGWPSFSRPIQQDVVVEKKDKSHGMERVEVRSKTGDAHLGHVFTDGPPEAGGLRYCINSAALRFIPVSEMAAKGYGDLVDKCLGKA